MQIMIDIPEEDYDFVKTSEYADALVDEHIRFAVKDGTPLPKGHGRLIDADELREESKVLLNNLIGMVEDNCNSDYDRALKMAIKALEQEPCGDAISREVVLDEVSNYLSLDIEDFKKLVRDMPSATSARPQTDWIPVSERLPDKGKQVLCCNKNGSVFTTAITFINSNGMVAFGQHYEVVAWMPLPEPYKGE